MPYGESMHSVVRPKSIIKMKYISDHFRYMYIQITLSFFFNFSFLLLSNFRPSTDTNIFFSFRTWFMEPTAAYNGFYPITFVQRFVVLGHSKHSFSFRPTRNKFSPSDSWHGNVFLKVVVGLATLDVVSFFLFLAYFFSFLRSIVSQVFISFSRNSI